MVFSQERERVVVGVSGCRCGGVVLMCRSVFFSFTISLRLGQVYARVL